MSTIGKEAGAAKPGGPDRGGLVSVSEQRNTTEGFRPPWQMSYAELCQQPIVLYRGMRRRFGREIVPGEYGFNWSPFPNLAKEHYSDGYTVFTFSMDASILSTLIVDTDTNTRKQSNIFNLSRSPEGVRQLTAEEIAENADRAIMYAKKGLMEEHLYPLEHKLTEDGKRVVYQPLILWMHGIEIALRRGETVPSEVIGEYQQVKELERSKPDFDRYEAEHNKFDTQ